MTNYKIGPNIVWNFLLNAGKIKPTIREWHMDIIDIKEIEIMPFINFIWGLTWPALLFAGFSAKMVQRFNGPAWAVLPMLKYCLIRKFEALLA